jgi:hypothetical protein
VDYLPNQTQFNFEDKMKLYEVAIPITGYQVYQVEAKSQEEAIELVNNGEVDTDDFDEIAWDLDTNNWDIEEIESDE